MNNLARSIIFSALISGVPTAALAQENTTTTPSNDQQASETAEGNAVAEFTPDMVDPANPFGEIDVTSAGATQEELTAFFQGLDPQQQQELASRCAVITNPVHQERYAEETTTQLCNNLISFELIAAPAAQ